MQILPIDVTALVATVLGISLVLIPVLGFTARYALKPTVEALSHMFDHKNVEGVVQVLERRVTLLEQQVEEIEGSVSRIAEAEAFHAALKGGRSGGSRPDPVPPTQP